MDLDVEKRGTRAGNATGNGPGIRQSRARVGKGPELSGRTLGPIGPQVVTLGVRDLDRGDEIISIIGEGGAGVESEWHWMAFAMLEDTVMALGAMRVRSARAFELVGVELLVSAFQRCCERQNGFVPQVASSGISGCKPAHFAQGRGD